MTPKMAKGLKQTIQQWEKYTNATDPLQIIRDEIGCPFWRTATGCLSCPVYFRTDRVGCVETPLQLAIPTLEEWKLNPNSKTHQQAFFEIVQAEIDFLKSFLEPRP